MKKLCLVALVVTIIMLCLTLCAACTVQAAYCDGVECLEPTQTEIIARDINIAIEGGDWQAAFADIAASFGCYNLADAISAL